MKFPIDLISSFEFIVVQEDRTFLYEIRQSVHDIIKINLKFQNRFIHSVHMINTQTTAKSLGKIDAIALVSGGLDSAIATKLVLEQGLKVVAMNFHSPFCTCSSQGCSAVGFSQKLDIPI